MCPEIFKGNYDEKCDIWSCGVFFCNIIIYLNFRLLCMFFYVVIHHFKETMMKKLFLIYAKAHFLLLVK